jgi:hypothetical protein
MGLIITAQRNSSEGNKEKQELHLLKMFKANSSHEIDEQNS